MKRVYKHLKAKGIDAYFIGQHQGRVTTPITTLRDGGVVPTITTNKLGQQVLDVIILTPAASYAGLEAYKAQVKAALAELPYLRRTGTETPPVVDDTKKAYTASIEYVIQKTL